MTDKTYIQEFTVKDDELHIRATSGNAYIIKKDSCSCKGFGFRRNCGHYKEAVEKDLLSLLTERKKVTTLTMSPQAIISRKKAIRQYLVKRAIKFSESIIDKLEKKVTTQMKPEEFLQLAQKFCKNLPK